MCVNEQIAKVMGWEVLDPEYNSCGFNGKIDHLEQSFDLYDWMAIKAMQRRMVADKKYFIGIEECPVFRGREYKFSAIAAKVKKIGSIPDVAFHVYADTEPAAIVALFCKVYEINDREET